METTSQAPTTKIPVQMLKMTGICEMVLLTQANEPEQFTDLRSCEDASY